MFNKKSIVGLDLGARLIKAMQIDRTNTGWKVSRTAYIQTPKDAIKEGVVIDPEAVGTALRQMLREQKFQATNAVIGVAGASVIVRLVRIPKMPEATLRKSIKFEASRYVPSSIEDSFIEFEILGESSDGQMDVLIVAAPRDVVETRLKACEVAGLEVDCVDVEAFAMYRSLIEASEEGTVSGDVIALVDVGAQTTKVSVINRGVFAMTRSISQAGQTITDALRTHFKLNEEEAEQGKSQLDLRDLVADSKTIESPPLRVIQPHVDDLIREIRRSLNYYQSQHNEGAAPSPVTHLVLSGGGANLPGLSEYMQHKLDMPVTRTGVFDNPRFNHIHDENGSPGLELAVVTGLAMRSHLKSA
ncbi:MAG: type IV pilus assembly protein PilM [Fimbriimonadaceae bacterium]|nr:type IV pilus assembly protein PilM [Fimbriimonadaceae bacterium]